MRNICVTHETMFITKKLKQDLQFRMNTRQEPVSKAHLSAQSAQPIFISRIHRTFEFSSQKIFTYQHLWF